MDLTLDRKKIITILVVSILLVGIVVAVYLVQRTQIFKPRATADNIIFKQADGSSLPTVNQDGRDLPQTDSLTVQVEFSPPLE